MDDVPRLPPRKRRRMNGENNGSFLYVSKTQINEAISLLSTLPASILSEATDLKALKSVIRKLKNAYTIRESANHQTDSESESIQVVEEVRKDRMESEEESEDVQIVSAPKVIRNPETSMIERLRNRGLPGLKIVDVGAISYNECGDEVKNTCLGRALVAASGMRVDHPKFDRRALNLLQIIGSAPGEVASLIEGGSLGAGKMYSNFWLLESMKYPFSPLYTSCVWIVQEGSTTLYIGPGYRTNFDAVLALYYSDLHYQILTGPGGEILNLNADLIKDIVQKAPKIHTIIPKIRPM